MAGGLHIPKDITGYKDTDTKLNINEMYPIGENFIIYDEYDFTVLQKKIIRISLNSKYGKFGGRKL